VLPESKREVKETLKRREVKETFKIMTSLKSVLSINTG
jgi:hypothetical protein